METRILIYVIIYLLTYRFILFAIKENENFSRLFIFCFSIFLANYGSLIFQAFFILFLFIIYMFRKKEQYIPGTFILGAGLIITDLIKLSQKINF